MTTTQQPGSPPAGSPDPRAAHRRRRLLAATAGLLAAGVALGVAELVTAAIGPSSSPVVAVGEAVIGRTPEPVKDFAVRTFGEHDKAALVTGTLVLLALFAVAVGLVSLRSRVLGVLGIVMFGALGAVAAISRPSAGQFDALPSVIGALAGAVALLRLVRPLAPDRSAGREPADLDRRRFLRGAGFAVAVAVVAGAGGRLLQRRFDVEAARAALRLPSPASRAAPIPASADLSRRLPGLTPLVTPPGDFYRVDTALTVPRIRPEDYRLRLSGMFDTPRSYTLPDLLGRNDLIERDVTLTCVSNEVGGGLAGTARWLGVPLVALLGENGVQPRSTQLVCRSSDGMTIGAPTRSALQVEGAMLAFGMDGRPLPVEHGFPVRMVIPGLYGYVSACKWLTSIEATTFDAYDAFWVRRGWGQQAPIKTASRIDAPRGRFAAGRRAVAGVAWAQTRGISRVEVRIDDGAWTEARLSPQVDVDIWRQWVLLHDFDRGAHAITVRATDGTGQVQTEQVADPLPDGATGWHTVRVQAA